MKRKQKEAGSEKRRGYTFTISVIFIAAVIIAAASYAREWRRQQDASFAANLPGSDALVVAPAVAGGYASLLGVSGNIAKNATHTSITVSGRFPFRKEGEALSDLHAYAAGLADSSRNSLKDEIALFAGGAGTNGTVLLLPDGGSVSYGNNGSGYEDQMLYVHPEGWTPAVTSLVVYCNKSAESTVSYLAQTGGRGLKNRNYYASYSDPGTDISGDFAAATASDVIYSVSFADGSNLSLVSNLSPSGTNALKLSYTKSPGAYVVLPFDGNASPSRIGTVIDYSQYGNNFTLGAGGGFYAPVWRSDCHTGGCYRFAGSPEYMYAPHINFSERNVEMDSPELLADGGLEALDKGTPDDGQNDKWAKWQLDFGGGSTVFDATALFPHSGNYGVKVIYSADSPISTDAFYQQPDTDIHHGVEYTLSFWQKDDDGTSRASYRIFDKTTNRYLQQDGISWKADANGGTLQAGGASTSYTQVQRTFSADPGAGDPTAIIIQFVPDPNTGGASMYYLDDVSLKDTTGLNGGFELYQSSGGSQDAFTNWAIKDDNNDATFMAEPGAGRDSVGIGLDIRPGTDPSSDPNAYIHTASLVLNNSTSYSLEFWTRSRSGEQTATLRYGVYDVTNGLFLAPDGTWSADKQIFDSGIIDTNYQKVVKNFHTLPTYVGPVELRFYVPAATGAYLDDVSITEVKDFTISMWLQSYGNAPGITPRLLYQYEDTGTSARGLDWTADGKTLTLSAYSDGQSISPQLTMPDGNWHMYTFVANRSGNYTIYLDGQIDQTANFSIGTLNNSAPFVLGNMGSTKEPSFNGSIDDFRLYQRALSGSEVGRLYGEKTQDECMFNLTVSYDNSGLLARELEVDYNAALRVRTTAPDEMLAMPFDFNTTSTAPGAVIDYSPYGAHGTIHTPGLLSWSNGCAVGGCYQFKGGGYIAEPAGLYDFGVDNFTISFWVKGKPGVDEALLSKGAWGAPDGWTVYAESAGPARIWKYWNGGAGILMGTVSSDWTHYAIARNGTGSGGLSIYQNGVLVATGTDSSNYNSGLPLTIGDTADADPTFYMDGASIDELRMFNRSLTASEVRGLYHDYSKVYDGPLVASRD